MLAWTLAVAVAADCPPVVELPAAAASSRDWSERLALATCTDRDAAEQPRAEAVARVLRLLQAHHPEIERGPLRGLVEAAGSGDGPWVEQAMRAARLGRSLPERIDASAWHDAVPAPVPEGTTLSLADGTEADLSAAAEAVATAAGWTVGDGPTLSLSVVGAPEPAMWGKQLGYAVEVTAIAGDRTVSVDGFAVGPLAPDTRRALLETAVAQVLADQELVQALAPDVEVGPSPATGALQRTTASEVCLFRRPDNASLPVVLRVGPRHEVAVPTASHGCLLVPTEMEIRSPYKPRVVPEGTLLLELSDRGEAEGRFRMLEGDAAYVEKMLAKGKLQAWTPELRPTTE